MVPVGSTYFSPNGSGGLDECPVLGLRLASHADGTVDNLFGDEAEAFVFADELICFAEHGVERFTDCAILNAHVAEEGDCECSHVH